MKIALDFGNRTRKLKGCNAERSRSSQTGLAVTKMANVASKMAVEIAIATFQRMNPVNTPKQILKQIFDIGKSGDLRSGNV